MIHVHVSEKKKDPEKNKTENFPVLRKLKKSKFTKYMVTLLRELITTLYKTRESSLGHGKYINHSTVCLMDLEKFSVTISHKSNFIEFCGKCPKMCRFGELLLHAISLKMTHNSNSRWIILQLLLHERFLSSFLPKALWVQTKKYNMVNSWVKTFFG